MGWTKFRKRDKAAMLFLLVLLVASSPVRKETRGWFWSGLFKWFVKAPLLLLYGIIAVPVVLLRAAKRSAWSALGWDQLGKGSS